MATFVGSNTSLRWDSYEAWRRDILGEEIPEKTSFRSLFGQIGINSSFAASSGLRISSSQTYRADGSAQLSDVPIVSAYTRLSSGARQSNNDYFIGGDGQDNLFGGRGADAIFGGPGIDSIFGESGQDYLFGGDTYDYINGGSSRDFMYGGGGADGMYGGGGSDFMYGGLGGDEMYGGAGRDYMYGEGGDDALLGDGGNDILDGGEGQDLAFYRGRLNTFQVTRLSNGDIRVRDRSAANGREGIDILRNIEQIQFSDRTIDVSSVQSIESSILSNNIYRRATPTDLSSPINGEGNNIANPEWGAADAPLLDNVPLQYGDGFASPTGDDRPNARVISNALSQQTGDIFDPRGMTNMIWAWGQFLDHDIDITLDAEGPEHTVLIEVPDDDPVFAAGQTINLQESEFIEGTGTDPSNPTQLANAITSWVDGSNVYGSGQDRLDQLRSFSAGRLTTSAGNYLPTVFEQGREQYIAGDRRANENVVLSSMHTLFMREHNRLADGLAAEHGNWTDEEIFQRARQINIAQMQNITFNEYLPNLLGEELSDYNGYDSSVNGDIARVFSNAAFRLGHTQLSTSIDRLDTDGTTNSGGNLLLRDSFFANTSVIQETDIGALLRGSVSTRSQQVDNEIIEDVRSLLFSEGPFTSRRDLAAINIERGRLNGVADYNTVREAYGLDKVTSFADITSNVEKQGKLSELYGTVDNIDAFVGFLAEDLKPGASVGETLTAIFTDQFTRLRDGDRFYFENSLSRSEANLIKKVTLADIIRRNTDTTIIQDNAFSLFNHGTNASEILNGGLGQDAIYGKGGNDTIFGEANDDRLFGDGGNDTILGGTGNDYMVGVLMDTFGFGEIDNLTGGEGEDYFVLGDTRQSYYDDGRNGTIGFSDYAYLADLNVNEDKVVLHGSAQDYYLQSTGSGSNLIHRSPAGGSEAIAVLEGVSADTALTSEAFVYVGG